MLPVSSCPRNPACGLALWEFTQTALQGPGHRQMAAYLLGVTQSHAELWICTVPKILSAKAALFNQRRPEAH